MTERCVSCDLPLSSEAELERLRQEVKDLKGDLRAVVRELNKVLPYFCTFCGGVTVSDTRTMDGQVSCRACLDRRKVDAQRRFARVEQAAREIFPAALAEAAAKAEIAAEDAAQHVPVNIIAKSRSIDRSDRSLLVDRIGQIEHDAWEAGFEAAVRIAEKTGATAVAQTLRDALADYWETQGVERED